MIHPTEIGRVRAHAASLLYPSDLTDPQWVLIEPLRPPPAQTGRPEEHPRRDSPEGTTSEARGTEAGTLAEAAIAALRPEQRARIDELGRRRLERAAAPLVAGWTTHDLARRIGAERLDRAESLAAVLCAVLRRYALEPAPRELRTTECAVRQERAQQWPPDPCAHGDPGGCTACSFCRHGLADPGGERCARCTPSLPLSQVVTA